ncbi:MAG: terminase small subunit [Finegoldia magna]|uniref:terminase small subunit n=1 Tax=Finegoldia magna TaxID=1260 RepID=UPI002912580D|nr:terminase small subunit [Finegoldia magna]MDU7032439.1 terminase small subunit [Finegoldia magna]
MKKLTIKQKKFADEYIKTGNVYQSAINAGYSDNYAKSDACKILEKPSVISYMEERMKKLESETIADQTEILQFLTRIVRGEEKEEVLVNVGNFEQEKQEIKISAKDRIKAAELLGKRYGSWIEKQEVDINLPTFIDDIQGTD